MTPTRIAGPLIQRLPFYYGWVILACVSCAAISRAGPAVATLSIFVEPMTSEFGWSRTALSGAVSLGGILAAIFSPMIGTMLDRRGPRLILCAAVLTTGVTILGLSQIHSLLAFYLLFCVARMNFAGPYDLGIYGAVNNWFVARRAAASSIVTVAQMAGLTATPLIGHFAMQQHGWREGWLARPFCSLDSCRPGCCWSKSPRTSVWHPMPCRSQPTLTLRNQWEALEPPYTKNRPSREHKRSERAPSGC
jgi:MFS transporter, OFA family, oxalate/formate antiporter